MTYRGDTGNREVEVGRRQASLPKEGDDERAEAAVNVQAELTQGELVRSARSERNSFLCRRTLYLSASLPSAGMSSMMPSGKLGALS